LGLIELLEAEKDLVHPDHVLAPQEAEIHPIERRPIRDDHAASTQVPVAQTIQSTHATPSAQS
jgi:hypothetical protein